MIEWEALKFHLTQEGLERIFRTGLHFRSLQTTKEQGRSLLILFCLVECESSCSEVDVSVHMAFLVGYMFSTYVLLRFTDLQDSE